MSRRLRAREVPSLRGMGGSDECGLGPIDSTWEKRMHGKSGDQSNAPSGLSVDRRTLLKTIAIAGAATSGGVLAPLTEARAEIWEEGDTQCRPPVQEVAPDYALDDAMLADFVKFSELLTGVKPLDHRLGSQYLERYARRPELTQFLPQLIGAYRTASSSSSSSIEAEIEKNIMQTSLRQAAAACCRTLEKLMRGWPCKLTLPNQISTSSLWDRALPAHLLRTGLHNQICGY